MKATPRRTQSYHPWVVWLAVLVAVLGALAPTVSHALMLASGQAPLGVEICTSEGPRWVTADAAASAGDFVPTPGSAVPPAHCQFCLQSTDRFAPLGDALPCTFPVPGAQREAPVWELLFHTDTHAVTPPPRGPPGNF